VFCKRSGFTTVAALSFTPGFSPVHTSHKGFSRFNGFSASSARKTASKRVGSGFGVISA
jgi:hypothetical protein